MKLLAETRQVASLPFFLECAEWLVLLGFEKRVSLSRHL